MVMGKDMMERQETMRSRTVWLLWREADLEMRIWCELPALPWGYREGVQGHVAASFWVHICGSYYHQDILIAYVWDATYDHVAVQGLCRVGMPLISFSMQERWPSASPGQHSRTGSDGGGRKTGGPAPRAWEQESWNSHSFAMRYPVWGRDAQPIFCRHLGELVTGSWKYEGYPCSVPGITLWRVVLVPRLSMELVLVAWEWMGWPWKRESSRIDPTPYLLWHGWASLGSTGYLAQVVWMWESWRSDQYSYQPGSAPGLWIGQPQYLPDLWTAGAQGAGPTDSTQSNNGISKRNTDEEQVLIVSQKPETSIQTNNWW